MNKKILIIDDEENLVELLRVNLAAHGFAVSAAPTGEEGLTKITADRPDAIILDGRLPERDGWKLCRTIKSTGPIMHIPVLFLTAATQAPDQDLAAAAGANVLMTKPCNLDELVNHVVRLTQ